MDRVQDTSLAKIGSLVGSVGLIACIVSTALDYWYYLGVSVQGVTGKVYFGLWEFCLSGNVGPQSGKLCEKWSTVESQAKLVGVEYDIAWLHACQAFMIMACIALGIGVMCGLLFAFPYKSSKILMVLGGILCIVAGSFCIIAASIFGAKYEKGLQEGQTGGSLHAGFYMAVVTVVLAMVGGVVILRNRYVYFSSYPYFTCD